MCMSGLGARLSDARLHFFFFSVLATNCRTDSSFWTEAVLCSVSLKNDAGGHARSRVSFST